MSKTTPVRWWRDDAERYNARPLIGVDRTWTQPTWAFELLKPLDPETQRMFDAMFEASRPERLTATGMLAKEYLFFYGPFDSEGEK